MHEVNPGHVNNKSGHYHGATIRIRIFLEVFLHLFDVRTPSQLLFAALSHEACNWNIGHEWWWFGPADGPHHHEEGAVMLFRSPLLRSAHGNPKQRVWNESLFHVYEQLKVHVWEGASSLSQRWYHSLRVRCVWWGWTQANQQLVSASVYTW